MSGTPLAPSESFRDLHAEVMDRETVVAPEKTKRRVGRPSNAEKAARGETTVARKPTPIEILPPETVAEIIALPFDLYAKRQGDHWALHDEEKKKIGELTAKVLNKHAPEWLARWGDELALATILGMALVSRVMIDLNERAKQESSRVSSDLENGDIVA